MTELQQAQPQAPPCALGPTCSMSVVALRSLAVSRSVVALLVGLAGWATSSVLLVMTAVGLALWAGWGMLVAWRGRPWRSTSTS